MRESSFDAILEHISKRGSQTPVPPELRGDLEAIVADYERFAARPGNLRRVQMSPYLDALLRVSGVRQPSAAANAPQTKGGWRGIIAATL